MPIQPTYPGVYVQEVSSGVRTISGVSTSIAAFFGRTEKGPIDKAVRCTSFSDFLRVFGGGNQFSDLGTSVRQFFDNGGTDCYVVRLAKGASSAEIDLTDLAKENVLTVVAKAPGVWGQDLKFEVDYNTPNPEDTFNLEVIQETNGSVVSSERHGNLSMRPGSPRFAPKLVSEDSKLIDLKLHGDLGDPDDPAAPIHGVAKTPAGFSESRRIFTGDGKRGVMASMSTEINKLANVDKKSKFLINVDGKQDIEISLFGLIIPPAPNTEADLTKPIKDFLDPRISAKVPGASVEVSLSVFSISELVDPADPAQGKLQGGVLRITAGFTDSPGITITRTSAEDFAGPMMLGIDQGGIEVARYSNLRPVPTGTVFTGGGPGFDDLLVGTNGLNAFAGLLQKDLAAIAFDAALPVPPTPITVGLTTTPVPPPPVDWSNFRDAAGGGNGVLEKLQIIKQAVNADPNSPCKAEIWGYRMIFRRKSGAINDSLTVASTPAAAAVLGAGFTVNVRRYSLGTVGTSPFQLPGKAGSDGVAPTQAEYEGSEEKHTGFYALEDVDLFNLMILPADSGVPDLSVVYPKASSYCEKRRAFLLLDAPKSWIDNTGHLKADSTVVNNFRVGISKQYAAVFFPKIQYSEAGMKKYIGPSGMIAGIMARTDSQRGVWKAPAGIEADLRGVLDVGLNLTDNENGILNKLGVNCIRKFPNGIVNWGARTLEGSDDFSSEWKYIPIRRLALFLEESLFRGTKWVVFEPNDEPLWAKIRMNLNAFMTGLFRQGAFQGSTPDKAFFVKCDGETTTQNDRNLGIVNIQVGFAPLKPAEFVIITIQQMAGDLV